MIRLPAYFTGFGSKTDGSARLSFSTQELQDTDFAIFKNTLNMFGWLIFKENEVTIDDLPEEEAYEDKEKTPSKRLRSVLFLYWKKKSDEKFVTVPFQTFYINYMEKLIEDVKSKLD